MTDNRFNQINEILKNHMFRFNWCTAKDGCACSGCVNWIEVEGKRLTKEEWQEWALSRALLELGVAKEHLKDCISLKQQKKIPTLQEYRDRLVLIDRIREYLKITETD